MCAGEDIHCAAKGEITAEGGHYPAKCVPQKAEGTGRPTLKMMQKQITEWRNPGALRWVLQPFSCTEEKDIGGRVAVKETSVGEETVV